MNDDAPPRPAPLRILHVEDNPLIVFHVEQMVEDLGHAVVGSFDSFAALRASGGELAFDGALIDIDLVDGRTGPAAAEWLHERGIPSIFLTGQAEVAADYGHLSLAILTKPIDMGKLGEALDLLREPRPGKRANDGAATAAGSMGAALGRP
ncbi:response regulator [Aureimonas pseudogalii]|uniref:CheY-like chemotaxis protein n=1 Tax=Aureimonas pseudogalii TaxID=1744844 RepID=A0A7W6E994_9HYPH|nr:response regulator [Aureimonas pseudogalii]MBB3997058.1 CheY-like chemotaxis protein [Aureimonas pseudogalii]